LCGERLLRVAFWSSRCCWSLRWCLLQLRTAGMHWLPTFAARCFAWPQTEAAVVRLRGILYAAWALRVRTRYPLFRAAAGASICRWTRVCGFSYPLRRRVMLFCAVWFCRTCSMVADARMCVLPHTWTLGRIRLPGTATGANESPFTRSQGRPRRTVTGRQPSRGIGSKTGSVASPPTA
jgi:hypothetical protein